MVTGYGIFAGVCFFFTMLLCFGMVVGMCLPEYASSLSDKQSILVNIVGIVGVCVILALSIALALYVK